MSKLKVSIKKSTVTAMMKAGRKERINETELSQLARIKPCGIMHVTKTKKDSVIYTCPANINLTDRLKKAISKYDFFFMIEQIVIMVEDVYNNGLNVNSVRFNMDDVYINEMTKEMYFIYFPIVGGQESADIVGFIENIIYTMTPVINEDTNYISRFMYYVRSFHGFNGNAIEKYISREERAVVNVLKNKAVTMQQTMQQQIMQQQMMQQNAMNQQMINQMKEMNVSDKSRLTYILLALFLGAWGIDNFYAGYSGKGIIQLLLGITLVGTFITVPWCILDMICVKLDGEGKRFK